MQLWRFPIAGHGALGQTVQHAKPPDFTITSAARFLRISVRTLERLLALAGVELELVH